VWVSFCIPNRDCSHRANQDIILDYFEAVNRKSSGPLVMTDSNHLVDLLPLIHQPHDSIDGKFIDDTFQSFPFGTLFSTHGSAHASALHLQVSNLNGNFDDYFVNVSVAFRYFLEENCGQFRVNS
jgi:hypothetical protein